jgi:hypothetical protein
MLTILDETTDALLAIRVSGKLTAEDFDIYRAQIRDRMQQTNAARLYFEMVDFDGWQPGSFIENAVFDIIHGREYGKVAMVGEKKWQEWAARIASPVKKEGVHYFDLSDKEKAMAWVKA